MIFSMAIRVLRTPFTVCLYDNFSICIPALACSGEDPFADFLPLSGVLIDVLWSYGHGLYAGASSRDSNSRRSSFRASYMTSIFHSRTISRRWRS